MSGTTQETTTTSGGTTTATPATILGGALTETTGTGTTTDKAPQQDTTTTDPAKAGTEGGAKDPAQDGKKPGEGEGDKGKPATGAPADIEVNLPDGVAADQGLLDKFKAAAKAKGMSSEQAQSVLDVYVEAQKDAERKAQESAVQQVKEWESQIRKDPELGGKDYDANISAAKKAIRKFATPALADALDSSGLGSHPEMLRFIARVGKALAEDSVAGSNNGRPQTAQDEFMGIYTNTKET